MALMSVARRRGEDQREIVAAVRLLELFFAIELLVVALSVLGGFLGLVDAWSFDGVFGAGVGEQLLDALRRMQGS